MKTYLFSYSHNGARWELRIQADSAEDAQQRLNRIPYATYDGELALEIPIPSVFESITGRIRQKVLSIIQ